MPRKPAALRCMSSRQRAFFQVLQSRECNFAENPCTFPARLRAARFANQGLVISSLQIIFSQGNVRAAPMTDALLEVKANLYGQNENRRQPQPSAVSKRCLPCAEKCTEGHHQCAGRERDFDHLRVTCPFKTVVTAGLDAEDRLPTCRV